MNYDIYGRHVRAILGAADERTSRASRTMGALLSWLISFQHVSTVIEIGISNGFTTRIIAESLARFHPDDWVFLTCDASEEHCQAALKSCLPLTKPAHARVIVNYSQAVDWRDQLAAFDRAGTYLAVVDGSHEYRAVKADLARVETAMLPSGWILCHDYPDESGVKQAVDEFLGGMVFRRVFFGGDAESGSRGFAMLQMLG